MRGRHCVSGGAPVNFGRRPRRAGSSKKHRRRGAGGQKSVFKIPEKISFHPKNFLMAFLRNRKMQQTWHRQGAIKFSAAVHRSPKVDGGAHKLTAAARRAHGSTKGTAILPLFSSFSYSSPPQAPLLLLLSSTFFLLLLFSSFSSFFSPPPLLIILLLFCSFSSPPPFLLHFFPPPPSLPPLRFLRL